jgi:uncharacterized C2H2 Zn-finger protein
MSAHEESLSIFGTCPNCGMLWGYDADQRLTRLIAIYDRAADRTVAWQCPGCCARWERDEVRP